MKISMNILPYLRNGNDIIKDPKYMSIHVVSYLSNFFLFCNNIQISEALEEVIPELVDAKLNNFLTMIPSYEEIQSNFLPQ